MACTGFILQRTFDGIPHEERNVTQKTGRYNPIIRGENLFDQPFVFFPSWIDLGNSTCSSVYFLYFFLLKIFQVLR